MFVHFQLSAPTKIAIVGDPRFQIEVWYKSAPSELCYIVSYVMISEIISTTKQKCLDVYFISYFL